MEPEGSLPRSQELATCPRHKPVIQSMSPHPTTWISILILSYLLRLGFQVVSSPQASPPKPCMHFCSPQHVLSAKTMIFLSIWTPEQYCVSSTDH